MSDVSTPAASAAAAIYEQKCSDFHSKPIENVALALGRGDEELHCCPRANQVAPLVAAVASLRGPVPDLTFTEAPELAYAAEAAATAFLYTERIKMVSCSLGGAGIAALARGLSGLNRADEAVCSVLDLSQNGLQAQDVSELVTPLQRAVPSLRALNLELNPLGSDGARALAPLLAPISTPSTAPTASLRVLSLRGCGVHDGGVSALSSALVQGAASSAPACSALRVLDLSDNPACSTGIVALCAALTSQLSINVATQRAGAATTARQDDAPGVAELLLREVKCDAAALQALAGLLLATADVHKQANKLGAAEAPVCVPGLQYVDLTGVASSSASTHTAGSESAQEYKAGALNLLHACQTLIASSSGAVQMDGLAQLQAVAEELHGSAQALAVEYPTPRGAHKTAPAQDSSVRSQEGRPLDAKWGAIMQRLQGATHSLAAVHGAAGGVAVQAAKSAQTLTSKLSHQDDSSTPSGSGSDAAEGGLPDGVSPAVAAYIQRQVQQAAKQLRTELDSDIGTLLTEVAATSARVERLEEVVRAEQQASMQLLESLMNMQQDPAQ